MWRQLITDLGRQVGLAVPATVEMIAALEKALGQPVPPPLAELLWETNGVEGEYSPLVWSAEEIVTNNLQFRTNPDFAEIYMPFIPLLFFGDNGGGDQFAFAYPLEHHIGVYVWDHETDSRQWVARSLEAYLRHAVTDSGGDWWR